MNLLTRVMQSWADAFDEEKLLGFVGERQPTARMSLIAATAARIAYPGMRLEVDGDTLRWHYTAIDVYTGQPAEFAGRPWPLWHIPDDTLEREVITTAFLGVRTILEHEARELFRIDKTHPFAPHSRPFNT